MKKGDIVKLKEGVASLHKAEIMNYVSGRFPVQEFYTVKDDPSYKTVGCAGEVELVMTLEEVPSRNNHFLPNCFEVVLNSGEPDITELMSVEALVEKI